jgi:hypothetical protein
MFRFTIRDLLWLMLVVALALGWGIRERLVWEKETVSDHFIRETKMWRHVFTDLSESVERRGGAVRMDFESSLLEIEWPGEPVEQHPFRWP